MSQNKASQQKFTQRKLAALDGDDLAVISAHIQDAAVVAGDILWRQAEKRLVVAMRRLDCEDIIAGDCVPRRLISALRFDRVLASTGAPYTILRPVVTLGAGAKGNIATLHRIAALRAPLPFGALRTKRSVLTVNNFNSAVLTVLRSENALNTTYVVADPEPVTLGALISQMRAQIGRRAGLLNVPERLIEIMCRSTGHSDAWDRIGRPLVVNPAKLLALGWTPANEAAGNAAPEPVQNAR